MLIKRAYTICSQEYLLETELQHLERVFIEINGYPSEVVRRIIQQVKRENRETSTEVANIEPTTERPKETLIILPYAGVQGEKIGKENNSVMKTVFQDKVVTKVAFNMSTILYTVSTALIVYLVKKVYILKKRKKKKSSESLMWTYYKKCIINNDKYNKYK